MLLSHDAMPNVVLPWQVVFHLSSVCPSVTLIYCGHITWVSKIITDIVRLGSLLLAASNTAKPSPRGTCPNFTWNRSGIWKKWLLSCNILETGQNKE